MHRGQWVSAARRVSAWLMVGHGRPVACLVMLVLAGWHMWLNDPAWGVLLDYYQRLFPRQEQHWPVVIVDIDEASIAALGQWPWPRTRLAALITATQQAGARAIGLDMILPEADRLSPDLILRERQDVSPMLRQALDTLPANDAILATVMQQAPLVVGRAALAEPTPSAIAVDEQTPVRLHGASPLPHVVPHNGHVTNIAMLERAAPGHGYLNARPDHDGVVRFMPLLVGMQDSIAPALALELARLAAGDAWYSVHTTASGIRGVQIGQRFIATDPDGRLRLYFAGEHERRRVSALAVLQGQATAAVLQDKIAIIGVTALGLAAVVTTPLAPRVDGVEVQAEALENMLSGARLIRPVAMRWWELGSFVVLALTLLVVLPWLRPGVSSVGLFLAGALLTLLGGVVAFLGWRIVCDPSLPVLGNVPVLVVMLTVGLRALHAELEKERLERSLRERELQVARDIQMGLLPAPWAITGLPEHLAFHALLEPAKEVGGDLYDAFMLDDTHFFFLVGDVVGKGVPAAFFMAISWLTDKSRPLYFSSRFLVLKHKSRLPTFGILLL
ncbi:MAG: CHASE2 domain-containing protein, partial [Candidatus Tectomicrobia bacterium]|nr:CHASE2 domain-containing protein [Candidatus Tectomicrobia bacterium]